MNGQKFKAEVGLALSFVFIALVHSGKVIGCKRLNGVNPNGRIKITHEKTPAEARVSQRSEFVWYLQNNSYTHNNTNKDLKGFPIQGKSYFEWEWKFHFLKFLWSGHRPL